MTVEMSVVSVGDIKGLLLALKDRDFEPGLDIYKDLLPGLNEVALKFGPEIEGNIFYPQGSGAVVSSLPDPALRPKRRNFAAYVMTGSSLLEIGFNAGHSALLALSCNSTLSYLGLDLGHHPYTRPCFDYLRKYFGRRVELLIGDSRITVPALRHAPSTQFDLFHIDGSHDFETAYSDLCNIYDFCQDGDVILFDDTNVSHFLLDELCDFFALKGLVTRIHCSQLWTGDHNVALRVNKPHR